MEKLTDDVEQRIKKGQEEYLEMLRQTNDPHYRPEKKHDEEQERKKPWLNLPIYYWLKDCKDLTLEERGIYSIIISHANRKPDCWPSISIIAKEGHCDFNTAKKYYDSLIKKGVVKVIGKKCRVKWLKIGY